MDKINYVDTDSIHTDNANCNYKTSLNKALDNYFELLSHASKADTKKQAIIKNVKKKRGIKNEH